MMIAQALDIKLKHVPELDPGFLPAAVWNRAYQAAVSSNQDAESVSLVLQRSDGSFSSYRTKILTNKVENRDLNLFYIERILKFLLWQKGASKVFFEGPADLHAELVKIYSSDGARSFDSEFMGEKVYRKEFEISKVSSRFVPEGCEGTVKLGRNMDGCRIGFDLGGSDRKCAAVIDGKVVFTEEIKWDPYFEKDPQYHIDGIKESLKRAAEHLPRVDAIGGSAAGVYVSNEPRVASLFRGVSESDFDSRIRSIFHDLKKEWGDIPFDVVNDGEVTALAGSMSMDENSFLGVAMGTSEAVGYVNENGSIMPWLNELAFAPVDYSETAPVDEWSGDSGVGAQYFSQQAVARLLPVAGFEVDENMPFASRLEMLQEKMQEGDKRAATIYDNIGIFFGYSIAHYVDFYDFKNLLVLGRVTSGEGGEMIISKAKEVLNDEFPELAKDVSIRTPNEQDKRHGQAVAAASLPKLNSDSIPYIPNPES